jgi:hypothetical protein
MLKSVKVDSVFVKSKSNSNPEQNQSTTRVDRKQYHNANILKSKHPGRIHPILFIAHPLIQILHRLRHNLPLQTQVRT